MLSELLGPRIPRAVVDCVRQLLPRNPRYLDLGCGSADTTVKVVNAVGAGEVYGVSVDKTPICRRRYQDSGAALGLNARVLEE